MNILQHRSLTSGATADYERLVTAASGKCPTSRRAGCGAIAALNREYLSYSYVGDISASGRSPPHQ